MSLVKQCHSILVSCQYTEESNFHSTFSIFSFNSYRIELVSLPPSQIKKSVSVMKFVNIHKYLSNYMYWTQSYISEYSILVEIKYEMYLLKENRKLLCVRRHRRTYEGHYIRVNLKFKVFQSHEENEIHNSIGRVSIQWYEDTESRGKELVSIQPMNNFSNQYSFATDGYLNQYIQSVPGLCNFIKSSKNIRNGDYIYV